MLLGREWMAITGKPLAATSGARTFIAGGNAVDAACTMLATTSTMWDTLGWGGETQALIWPGGTARHRHQCAWRSTFGRDTGILP